MRLEVGFGALRSWQVLSPRGQIIKHWPASGCDPERTTRRYLEAPSASIRHATYNLLPATLNAPFPLDCLMAAIDSSRACMSVCASERAASGLGRSARWFGAGWLSYL